MKFGHLYRHSLEEDGYPPNWIDAAISYNEMKKCIKRVRQELALLGLDAETLQQLLESAEKDRTVAAAILTVDRGPEDERLVRYEFTDTSPTTPSGTPPPAPVKPKLLVLVDEETGRPLDARLAPETKDYIHQLALKARLTTVRITEIEGDSKGRSNTKRSSTTETSSPDLEWDRRSSNPQRLIEVPLTNDSMFFKLLQDQLYSLVSLQDEEKRKLNTRIAEIGKELAKATNPDEKKSKQDLAHWRKLFELYIDSRVFFAIAEQDHGAQSFIKARARYMDFVQKAQEQKLLDRFKRKESLIALQQFLAINTELLQNLRFHEINQTAMDKILKKFDKRTALGVKATFPNHLPPSMLSEDIAKGLSAQVAAEIISIVPQLDDYLCPICSELAWRPVRLRCQHTYCIRCLIRLQREGKENCPLCRDGVVMMADSCRQNQNTYHKKHLANFDGTANLDPALINFLKKYFPDEVKAKQKLNNRLANIDRFGEEYVDKSCSVM